MTKVATCRVCGKRVTADARLCPHCGQFSPAASSVTNVIFGWFSGLGRRRTADRPGSQRQRGRSDSARWWYCLGLTRAYLARWAKERGGMHALPYTASPAIHVSSSLLAAITASSQRIVTRMD